MTAPGEVPSIKQPGFEAEVHFDQPVVLVMRGNADIASAGALVAMVEQLHAALTAARATLVIVDIAQLEFMNASSFNVFVTWVALVLEHAPENRYQIRFRSSPNILWQARSLRTLSCFATDLIEIES